MKTLVLLIMLSSVAQAATYYIDYASGSDANNGTSKITPWQRAPGMKGFSATYVHAAGDQFIFKGGVTWTGVFQWLIPNSGTNGNSDYYGVDQTWFTGGAWSRPIFDMQYSLIGYSSGAAAIFLFNKSYVTLDNFEVEHFEFPNGKVIHTGVAASGTGSVVTFDTSGGSPSTISNAWIVGATFTTTACSVAGYNTTYTVTALTSTTLVANGVTSGAATGCTITQTNQQLFTVGAILIKSTTPGILLDHMYVHDGDMAGTIVAGSVASGGCGLVASSNTGGTYIIQNSDVGYQNSPTATCGAVAILAGSVINTHAHHATQGIFAPGIVTIAGNTVDNILNPTDPTLHTNAVSVFCPSEVYNNKILQPIPAGAEILFMNSASSAGNCGASTLNSHIYNNVLDGSGNNNPPINIDTSTASTSNSAFWVWNNTMVAVGTSGTNNSYCGRLIDRGTGHLPLSLVAQNNHCMDSWTGQAGRDITWCPTGVSGCVQPVSAAVLDHNTSQTLAAANAQGYTSANFYAPTGGGATIGAGTNLTAQSIATLDSDILGVPRPGGSTAWDTGAYFLAATTDTVLPSPLTLTSTIVTNSTQSTITITNTGGTNNLFIGSMSITGGNANQFSFSTSPATNCGGSIAPSGTCTVTITFAPTLVSALTATFNVQDSNAGLHTVTLNGTGLPLNPPATAGIQGNSGIRGNVGIR